MHERAETAQRRAVIAREAGRLIGLFHRDGAEATLMELRRICGDQVDGLVDEIDAMDPGIAQALRAAGP